MQFLIIEFLEYELSGLVYVVYLLVMLIFSLACLGVVGERKTKAKQAKMLARREAKAREESERAKELVKKQAESYGVNNILDPTLKQQPAMGTGSVLKDDSSIVGVVNQTSEVAAVVSSVDNTEIPVVDNVTPIVENSVEGANKKEEEIPAVLIINDDGSSNVSGS